MTDRINALTLVFAEPIREDDAEVMIAALKMYRNVAAVLPNVADFTGTIAREQARQELISKLWEVVQ